MKGLPIVEVHWLDACRAEGCPFPKDFSSSLVPQISYGLLLQKKKECIVILQNYTLYPGDQSHDYLVIPGIWVREIKEHGSAILPNKRGSEES